MATTPQGEVILFTHAGRSPDAPLAYLLGKAREQKSSLLVDLELQVANPQALTRVSGTNLWRASREPAGRLRDWVLFLDGCRAQYNLTALSHAGAATSAGRLPSLVDRVVVLASSGRDRMHILRHDVQALRTAGVQRCECLLLDAA